MTTDEAKKVFDRFFIAFPQFREWLRGTADPEATYAEWLKTISVADFDIAMGVVDDMKAGKLDVPAAFARELLPIVIRRESQDRWARQNARTEQEEKYHGHSRGTWKRTTNDKTGRIAVLLGERVKEGKLSREENDRRMVELLEWDKGRIPTPEWMADCQIKRPKQNPFQLKA